MINSEFHRFTITPSHLLQENRNEAVTINKDGKISLSSLYSLKDEGPLASPIGICIDKTGIIFVIDRTSNTIHYLYPEEVSPIKIPCIGGHGTDECCFNFDSSGHFSGGIAVNANFIVVAEGGNQRIQCFFRRTLQISFVVDKFLLRKTLPQYDWPDFIPSECIIDCYDDVYIIDSASSRILRISHRGNCVTVVGEEQIKTPTNCFLHNDNSLYVLDIGKQIVFSKPAGRFDKWIEVLKYGEAGIGINASGIAITSSGQIYMGEDGDNSGLLFHIWNTSGSYTGCIPNLYGSCRRIIAGHNDTFYAECADSGIVVINGSGRYASEGHMFSRVFDCGVNETQWHRISADTILSQETRFAVDYFSSDKKIDNPWLIETDKWCTAIEITGKNERRADCLLTNARGRFLALRIRLGGDGVSTPVLEKVCIYFPHRSYLRYLPAIYNEDIIGHDLMDRFLSLFESFNMDMDERIGAIGRLLNPLSTNEDFLPWLASWFGIVKDQKWPEEKFRQLLADAYPLFCKRGTIDGLSEIITLYTGKSIQIIEHFAVRRPMVLGSGVKISETAIVGKKIPRPFVIEESSIIGGFSLIEQGSPPETPFIFDAYDFTIVIDACGLTDHDKDCLRRLIEQEKPAHTRCFINMGDNSCAQIGRSLIGIDTKLSHEYETESKNLLGVNTILRTRHQLRGVYGARSYIETDFFLH